MTPITLQLIKKPAIYGMILLFSGLPLVCPYFFNVLFEEALWEATSRYRTLFSHGRTQLAMKFGHLDLTSDSDSIVVVAR